MRAARDPRHRLVLLIGVGLTLILVAWLVHATGTEPVDSFVQCVQAGYVVSDTNPPVCAVAHELYLGPLAPSTPTPQLLSSQAFTLLVDGDSNSTYPRRWQVITSQAEWVSYWSQIHAALPTLPPLLPVDFTSNDVVALSEGREPTTGYSLKITNISTGESGSEVDVSESIPTTTCHVATNTTGNHYYIVETAKLPAPVSFRVSSEPRHCSY